MKGEKSEQKNFLKIPRRLVEKRSWIVLWQQGGTLFFSNSTKPDRNFFDIICRMKNIIYLCGGVCPNVRQLCPMRF